MKQTTKSATPSWQNSSETSHMDNSDEEHTNTSSTSTSLDLSLLKKPTLTSVMGFQEAKKAYDDGTEEVRKLLSNECDLIYECKVCRNVCRSLANFISHKRVYCQTSFSENHSSHYSNNGCNQDISTIIAAEEKFLKTRRAKNPRIRRHENMDLSEIVERLRQKQKSKEEKKLSEGLNGGGLRFQSSASPKDIVIQLNSVPESKAAVYQTVKRQEDDNIRAEVNEVREMLARNVVLGPDGKAILENHNSSYDVECEICGEKFGTEKTLKLHIEKKHIPSTVVYSCPSCSETFLQPSAVLKHLSQVHNKSQKRIRQMRENICKKAKRSDEVAPARPSASRELSQLSTDLKDKQEDLSTWLGEVASQSTACLFCRKTFERKAVRNAHMAQCRMAQKRPSTPRELLISKQSEGVNKRKRKEPSKEVVSSEDLAAEISRKVPPGITIVPISLSSEEPVEPNGEPPSKKKKKDDTPELPKNVPCSLCAKKFFNNANLKRHIAMFHFRINRFACKLCAYRGYRRVDTIAHLGNMHSIRGEKEVLNEHIQMVVKDEDDGRPPINADEGYDFNVTFTSVIAMIDKEEADRLVASNEKLPMPLSPEVIISVKEEDTIEIKDEVLEEPKQVDLSSGMSSPTSEKNLDLETRRPLRARSKPMRNKDFVYDINTIIKQEAEVHREQQLQQTLLQVPVRSSKRRSTETAAPKEKEPLLTPKKEEEPIQIDEVSGAAQKMAKIEVMNQRAAFHKPPEMPQERPFVPLIAPRRDDLEQPKETRRSRKEKTKEFQRTLSFTDTLLLQTEPNRGKLLIERSKTIEPVPQFPPTKPQFSLAEFASQMSAASEGKRPKASKKQNLSSTEQSQIEMLQQFRNQNSGTQAVELRRTPTISRRMSMFPQTPDSRSKRHDFSSDG